MCEVLYMYVFVYVGVVVCVCECMCMCYSVSMRVYVCTFFWLGVIKVRDMYYRCFSSRGKFF